MATESLLIAAGIVAVTVAAAIVAAPWIQADMRRAVERRAKPPVDMTAIALMIVGAAIVLGVPATAGLLWATWA